MSLRDRVIQTLKQKASDNRKTIEDRLKPKEFTIPKTLEELRALDATTIREILTGPHKASIDKLLDAENEKRARAERRRQREEDDKKDALERQMAERITGSYNHD